MQVTDLTKKIRDFLFSTINREFLIYLFFFAVAGIFWLMMTLNETYEQEVSIPVRFTNITKQAVLTSPETDTIRVTIRDKGYELVRYLPKNALHPVFVDFKTYAQQGGRGLVPTIELSKQVASQLSVSSKVVSVKPERLTFYYNYGESKRVPVHWRGTVTPENLFYLSDVKYDPDTITIYASREKLDSISTVYTEPLHYANFNDTLTVKAQLTKMAGVKTIPQQVSISFMTDVLTEESFANIPVTGINVPQGKVLRTFPAKVGVRFVTGAKHFRTLQPTDFVVVADYNEIKNNPLPKCNITLQSAPDGISKVELSTKQVDYLIEEQD